MGNCSLNENANCGYELAFGEFVLIRKKGMVII